MFYIARVATDVVEHRAVALATNNAAAHIVKQQKAFRSDIR